MERSKGTQTIIIAMLACALVVMSLGFAGYASDVSLNGTVTASAAKWDIKFDEASYAETTNSAVGTTNFNTDFTTLTYSVTLAKPGDFYEFTIDAVNGGTFDVALKSIVLSGLSTAQAQYITYSLTYNGVTYNSSTTGLDVALNAGASQEVTVRVAYIQPDDESNLPSTDQSVSLTATLHYDQVAS